MRTLAEITSDIAEHEAAIDKLEEEKLDFRKQCPHPVPFLNMKRSDFYDECGGPGIYEYSTATVTCSLCGTVKYMRYDKKSKGILVGEYSPTAEKVINS